MKKRTTFSYLLVIALSAIVLIVLAANIVTMYRLTSAQTEELGRMRIEIKSNQFLATNVTKKLDRYRKIC